MSAFSALNVFKSLTKSIASQRGWQLADARERLSVSTGFTSFHELRTTAEKHPQDSRLLRYVFGVDHFDEVVFIPDVLQQLKDQVALLAKQNSLVNPKPSLTINVADPKVSSNYRDDTGVLVVLATTELTGITEYSYGNTFQFLDARFDFEVKFRELRWHLVLNSVHLSLAENETDEDIDEDFWFDEFPSSEFWD